MEVSLCDTKSVVRQQSGLETPFAPSVIMRYVIHVAHIVKMHSPASNTRQDAETNAFCT